MHIATQNCKPDSPIIQDFLLKIIMEANGLITLGKEYKIDHISLLTIKKTMIQLMTMHRKLDVCTEYKSYQSSKTH